MKSRVTLAGVFLVVSLWVCSTLVMVASTKDVLAAGPVTLKVYDPTGAINITQLFSPRLADLNGKTICEVSNDEWEAYRTFPMITDLLQKQFPTAKFIASDKFPTASTDINPKLVDAVKAAGCQAVIVGNAG
jgi:hypothetical protein